MSYNATNWPPLQYPTVTPQKELWNAQAAPSTPSAAAPAATTAKVTWQAASALPNTTTYYSVTTTQVQIDTQFRITDRRLLPAASTLDADGNTIVLAPPL